MGPWPGGSRSTTPALTRRTCVRLPPPPLPSEASPGGGCLGGIVVHGARAANCSVALARLVGVASSPNVDTIPLQVWRSVRLATSGRGLSERALQSAVGSHYAGSSFYDHAPSRPRLAKLADVLEDPNLQDLATGDLVWGRGGAIE